MTKTLPPLAPAESLPGPPLYVQLQLIFAATNAPQNVPSFVVPPGASVVLFPTTSTGVNAHASYIGEQPELLGTTGSRVLPAGADVSISLPVDNTGKIWAMGTMGDGVLVVVSAPQIG
jgi:hypothetical protein